VIPCGISDRADPADRSTTCRHRNAHSSRLWTHETARLKKGWRCRDITCYSETVASSKSKNAWPGLFRGHFILLVALFATLHRSVWRQIGIFLLVYAPSSRVFRRWTIPNAYIFKTVREADISHHSHCSLYTLPSACPHNYLEYIRSTSGRSDNKQLLHLFRCLLDTNIHAFAGNRRPRTISAHAIVPIVFF